MRKRYRGFINLFMYFVHHLSLGYSEVVHSPHQFIARPRKYFSISTIGIDLVLFLVFTAFLVGALKTAGHLVRQSFCVDMAASALMAIFTVTGIDILSRMQRQQERYAINQTNTLRVQMACRRAMTKIMLKSGYFEDIPFQTIGKYLKFEQPDKNFAEFVEHPFNIDHMVQRYWPFDTDRVDKLVSQALFVDEKIESIVRELKYVQELDPTLVSELRGDGLFDIADWGDEAAATSREDYQAAHHLMNQMQDWIRQRCQAIQAVNQRAAGYQLEQSH